MLQPSLRCSSLLLLAFLLSGGAATVLAQIPPAGTEIRFSRDILPMLAENCLDCHGPDEKARKARLRLDTREGATSDGNGVAAIVPGHPEKSELLARITSREPSEVMPPPKTNRKLSPTQVDLLRRWIAGGAKWGKHWAFEPPQRVALPPVKDRTWPKNPIDYFVLARLEREGLKPSPPADPYTLIRRLYLDLIGLPPTPEEADAFVKDRSEQACEKVVDRLLRSPHYGERWARPWLDAARYADSSGFQRDDLRDLWPYRDWVVQAMNADMPFDRFTIEQIAGDLLPNTTQSQKVATGFHRCAPCNVEAGTDQEENRTNQIFDRVNTTVTVWLGLTFECAQCHDHKYDPFTMKDYYRLFACYNNTPRETDFLNAKSRATLKFTGPYLPLLLDVNAPADEQEARRQADPQTGKQREPRHYQRSLVMQELATPRMTHILQRGEFLTPGQRVEPGTPEALPPWSNETPRNRLGLAQWLVSRGNPLTARVTVNRWWAELFGRGLVATPEDFGSRGEMPTHPDLLDWLAVELMGPSTPLSTRGRGVGGEGALAPLAPVLRGEGLGVRGRSPQEKPSPPDGTRARPSPPTPRPGVPGRGEQESANRQKQASARPPQPSPTRGEGAIPPWSMKHLHRLIVTSATYRQSSRVTPALLARDDQNRLLARGPRIRLDAEAVRDNALACAGLLSHKLGGPPIRPPQPPGLWRKVGGEQYIYTVSPGEEKYRRGLYVLRRRSIPYPSFANFDASPRVVCVVRPSRSNTPLQALTLFNDPVYVEAAAALAQRVLREAEGDDARLTRAFRLCLARPPRDSELTILRGLLQEQRRARGSQKMAEVLAWTDVASALLNLDETITRN